MIGADIFMAGAEVETLTRALVDNGVRWILYSFYYIHDFKKADFIHRMQDEHPQIEWLLDSGAFTYWAQKKSGKVLPDPDRYVKLYFDYLDQYGERWCRVAEPDLDMPGGEIGTWKVNKWREEMLTRWPHLPVMPVYHGWRTRQAWTEYCQDPRIKHLSFGQAAGNVGILRQLCLEARKYNKPVHGFGFTRVNTSLKMVPCSSVDSTSWVMGQKFGTIYVFKNNKLTTLNSDKKDLRKLHRGYFTAIGCDPIKVENDDVAEVRKANILAWRNLAERFHVAKIRRERVLTGLADGTIERGRIREPTGNEVERPRAAQRAAATPPRSRERTGTEIDTGTKPRPQERGSRILGPFGVPIAEPTTRQRAKPRE